MKVENHFDLLTLHRIILEAKFCDAPNDTDVSMSPQVAKMSIKVVNELIEGLIKSGNTSEVEGWQAWRNSLHERPRELNIIRSNIKKLVLDGVWSELSEVEQKEAVIEFAAPFLLSEEQISELMP